MVLSNIFLLILLAALVVIPRKLYGKPKSRHFSVRMMYSEKRPAFCSFPLGCLNLCVSHDLLLHLSIGKRIARIFSVCILLFHVKEKYEVLDVSC